MNLAVSTAINSRFFKYLVYKIKTQKTKLIITAIMGALSYPLFFGVLALTFDMNSETYTSFLGSATIIGVLALAIYFIMGVVIGVSISPYLHHKTLTDMGYSLPLSTKERFWGDFTSGLLVYTVPYIIGSIVGLIFYLVPYYGDFETFETLSPAVLASYMATGLVILIMMYILTVFISTFCGSIVEATIYTLIMNGVIPGVLALVSSAIFMSAYGIDYGDIVKGLISTTSPLGLLIATMIHTSSSYFNSYSNESDSPNAYLFDSGIIIPIIIIYGIILATTYFIHKHRRAEQTGLPFVYKTIYHVILTLIIFTVTSIFVLSTKESSSVNHGSIFLAMMITSFIIFVVLDIVTNRALKKFWLLLLRYAATTLLSYAAIMVVYEADGFGMTDIVPDLDNINSVTISYDPVKEQYTNLYSSKDVILNITDKEVISIIRDAHIHNIEDYYDTRKHTGKYSSDYYGGYNNSSEYQYTKFKVTYHLKFGAPITREYDRMLSSDYEKMTIILTTDASKKYWADNFYNVITNEKIKNGIFVYNIAMDSRTAYKITNNTKQLAEAIKKDLLAETKEQVLSNPIDIAGYITINYISEKDYILPIKPHYENTLAFLKENNLDQALGKKITDNEFKDMLMIYYQGNNYPTSILDENKVNDLRKHITKREPMRNARIWDYKPYITINELIFQLDSEGQKLAMELLEPILFKDHDYNVHYDTASDRYNNAKNLNVLGQILYYDNYGFEFFFDTSGSTFRYNSDGKKVYEKVNFEPHATDPNGRYYVYDYLGNMHYVDENGEVTDLSE